MQGFFKECRNKFGMTRGAGMPSFRRRSESMKRAVQGIPNQVRNDTATCLTDISAWHIVLSVIKSFGDSETEKIWNGRKSTKLPSEIHKRAFSKLLIINSAESEEDLKIPPGNKFEHLRGDLRGFCSIRINNQWRIQFKFHNNEAYEVRIVDYH